MSDYVEVRIKRDLRLCMRVIEQPGKCTLFVQVGSRNSGGFSLKNDNRKEEL
jgi:hypothetical protein